jgi:hypothetical protein
MLADSDSDGGIISDEEMAGKEAKDRGRKRKRASSPGDLMMDDEDFGGSGSAKKSASGRTLTP